MINIKAIKENEEISLIFDPDDIISMYEPVIKLNPLTNKYPCTITLFGGESYGVSQIMFEAIIKTHLIVAVLTETDKASDAN